MFKKLEVLDKNNHKDLRFSKSTDFSFAKSLHNVPLALSEIRHASGFYPVIFPTDNSFVPTALLSLNENENLYVDAQNKWVAPYIPLQIRLYPFTLAKIHSTEDEYTLCIDRGAAHFSEQGDPLYTADGELADFVKGILNSLESYQKELNHTQAIFADMGEKELIIPKTLNFKMNDQPKSIGGFNGVDMEKLMNMDDAMLAGLVRNGCMQVIFNHIESLTNIAVLLNHKK